MREVGGACGSVAGTGEGRLGRLLPPRVATRPAVSVCACANSSSPAASPLLRIYDFA